MSIVGIFTNARPKIGGLYFDATLEESTELQTDVTEFPIENGSIGNDHAVNRPLRLSMRVGISDNAFRAARAAIPEGFGTLGGIAGTQAIGGALSAVPASVAAAAGLGASVANAAYLAGQATTRSQSALESIREVQGAKALIDVVGLKREYKNCLITNTRQETNKENEQALELVVEMTQLITVPLGAASTAIPAPGDPVSSQAQPTNNLGIL